MICTSSARAAARSAGNDYVASDASSSGNTWQRPSTNCGKKRRGWNSVQSPGEDGAVLVAAAVLDICAYAEVLAAASISHSGAMASIQPTILKEAVCSL
jgi:hypothetical protein